MSEHIPRTIAFLNTKGGVGKTTSALMCAFVLAGRGLDVEVRDLDPQGSASEWLERAREAGDEVPFSFVPANARTVGRDGGGRWVVIDTPPAQSASIEAAVEAADFVVIPSEPAGLDLDRVWHTVRVMGDRPHAVLLTKTQVGTRLLTEALQVLSEQGVAMFETVIPLRQGIKRAFGHVPGEFYGYERVVDEMLEAMA